ncbi:MAG: glycine--tRNA ligase [Actinomycetales bacterium]|nr:MAG: glycine--tRNA ligase [Actinomycetales bacterium]
MPFGIAQIGKAFRNEIVAKNFIFRIREFEQMEIEYFIDPEEEREPLFEQWLKAQEEFASELGIKKEDLRRYEHPKDKLSHYSKKTVDTEFAFPFGTRGHEELFGLAHRTDFDLTQQAKFSGQKLEYFDPVNNRRYVPHVLEPTVGVERLFFAALVSAYTEEEVAGEKRVVLKFPTKIAPIKVAILPLSKKAELAEPARKLFNQLKAEFVAEYDETQSIGKRYRRQDEIGTPYCVTVDFETLEDDAVTVRERDTMKQERVKLADLQNYLQEKLA